jgi:hypothetical protein
MLICIEELARIRNSFGVLGMIVEHHEIDGNFETRDGERKII